MNHYAEVIRCVRRVGKGLDREGRLGDELSDHLAQDVLAAFLLRRSKAEHDNLRMAGLPVAEIDTVTPDPLPSHMSFAMQKAEKFFGLFLIKEWTVEKFVHPIHLVIVGEIKRNLDVFV